MPTDEEIENAIVHAVYSGALETSTVSTVRSQAEEDLGLSPGFLKTGAWKARSKDLIVETFDKRQAQLAGNENQQEVQEVQDVQDVPETKKESAGAELDSDSDLSDDIIDDGPPPKKRKSNTTKATTKKEPPVKKEKAAKSTSKKSDEISKLKSHLLQCGIRKQWAKLLNPMGSDNERIRYLRGQLEEVGMTGRFSLAKAKEIKQRREYEQEMKDLTGEAERILESTPPRRAAATRKKRALVVQSDSESEQSQTASGSNESVQEDGTDNGDDSDGDDGDDDDDVGSDE